LINTRYLMTASALAMGAAGFAGSFLPDEILRAMEGPAGGLMPTIVQLLGALWLAGAMTNWTSRGNAIGGIYGRPLAVGNVTHFAIGAITLGKLAIAGGAPMTVLVGALVYAIFAIAFAAVMFSAGPVSGSARTPTSRPLPPTP
jgi:hypothetical protein